MRPAPAGSAPYDGRRAASGPLVDALTRGAPRATAGGAALDAVGPGSLLGGRYALRQRLDDAASTSVWQAHDHTLDRLVVVLVVGTAHPHAAAMLDAARRAAGVEDSRLVRVLDVGREDAVAYVVSEWVEASTLTARLRNGPLPAHDVRTMIGEAALALENARYRGLHHLALTPDDVHLLDDDSVKVAGLAVRAALAGNDLFERGDTPDAASAADTVALVALAYAGLTGYWPLKGRTALAPAPQVAGAPAAPSEIVSGVPADLDALCAQTFAGAGAPSSPGDLAGQIAPWGRARRPVRATGAFPLPLSPVRPTLPAATRDQDDRDQDDRDQDDRDQDDLDQDTADDGSAVPLPVPTAGPRASVAPASKAEYARTPRPAKAPRPARTPRSRPGQAPRGTGTDFFAEHLERPAPFVPPTPVSQPAGTQTRTVLLLVLGFLAVFFLLAYCGIRGLGDNAFVPGPRRTPTPSATPTPTPTTPAPSATPTAGPPVRVSAVTGFDPQGDGSEKNSIAGRAVDGDPATSWTSDTYRTQTFGGLKKGVGLLLDLGAPTSVRSVAVAVGGSGSTLQLRTATGDTLEGSTVVAQASETAGTLTLTPSSPVTSRYLVLWFTAAASSDGGYRVVVDEVTLS